MNKTVISNHTSLELLENSTEFQIAYYNLPLQDYITYFKCFWFSVFTLSAATLIFSVVSWIMIPKWRQFRNYVFLNILLSGSICLCLCFFTTISIQAPTYFHLAFNHWLVVATVMFYLDLVNTFDHNRLTEHRFLKSTVFGWIMPGLLQLLKLLAEVRLAYFTTIEFLVLFILYLRVFYALYKMNHEGISKMSVILNVLKSILALILSGFILYFSSLFMFMFKIYDTRDIKGASYVFVTVLSAELLFVNFVFLFSKINCQLWVDYINRKKSLRL